ncbi:aspartic peptidase domain-containing protein [Phycomyces nitens]|nr:aspartic peptidase domain-containing protein [Phycomyces nitens]
MLSLTYLLLSCLAIFLAKGFPISRNRPELLHLPIIHNSHKPTAFKRQEATLLKKRGYFQAPLYNINNVQYVVQMSFGTPPQEFTLILDTGSANLWIPSTQCDPNLCPNTRFDQVASSTFTPTNLNFAVNYGTGNASGSLATDTVTIAGATVLNQPFGVATSTFGLLAQQQQPSASPESIVQPSGHSTTANGVLGLGFPKATGIERLQEKGYMSFVFNLVEQNVIPNPVFSIYLNASSISGPAGEIIFGGVDQTKYSGDLVYFSVIPSSMLSNLSSLATTPSTGYSDFTYWVLHGQGITVNNNGLESAVPLPSISPMMFDTGATLSFFPYAAVEFMLKAITGPSGYQFDPTTSLFSIDCKLVSSNATIQLHLSTTVSSAPSSTIINIPVANLVYPGDARTLGEAKACVFGVAASLSSVSSSEFTNYIVGDSILRSLYLVYDLGQKRIGVAANSGMGSSVTGYIPAV